MSRVIITLFLLLSCLIQKIYSKPLNEGNNGNNNNNENQGNKEDPTLKIFIIIVVLFVLCSLLYFTKSIWWDAIKECCCQKSSVKSPKISDIDMDVTDQIFENIEFDSINFSEVKGNSKLSIDITNIFDKYDSSISKDDSSIIEVDSLSQSNVPKPNSKTFSSLNNSHTSSNIENYNAFENELNNLKTQEITETKIPGGETSYIENTPNFFNEESDDVPKILIGINNIEVVNNVDTQSLEGNNNALLEDSIMKEKCSIKSKKSALSKNSQKSGNSEEEDYEESSHSNSGINMNDEKTLINKSLKPIEVTESSEEESYSDNRQESSKENENVSSSNVENKTNEIKIVIQSDDNDSVDVIAFNTASPQSSTSDKANEISSQLSENENATDDEYEEDNQTMGAKIDPVTTNDDSISSFELGAANSTSGEDNSEEEEINEEVIPVNVDSLELTKSNNENDQSHSFAIVKDNESAVAIEADVSAIEDKTNDIDAIVINDGPVDGINEIDHDVESIPEPKKVEEKIETVVESIPEPEKVEEKIETEVESVPEPEKVEEKIETEVESVPEPEKVEEKIEAEVESVPEPEKVEEKIEAEVESVQEPEKVEEKVEEKIEVAVESTPEPEKIEEKIEAEVESIPEPEKVEEKIEAAVESTPEPEKIEATVESIPEPEKVEEKIETSVESTPEPEKVEEKIETSVESTPEPEKVEEKIEAVVESTPEPEKIEEKIEAVVESTPEPEKIEEKIEAVVESTPEPEKVEEKIETVVELVPESEVHTEQTDTEQPLTEIIESKKEQMEIIEQNIQALQQSIESDIVDAKPPTAKDKKIFNNQPPLKLNKRTSSLNLHLNKRKESMNPKIGKSSSKKTKHHKKIKQSIDEEIQSIANEINNDTIKEKFNDYVERRSSIQSDASGSSSSASNKRASALSAYIIQNENPSDDSSDLSIPTKSNSQTSSNSKVSLNIDTTIDESRNSKEDYTPDKSSPLVSPSSSQLHNQLRSPTPTSYNRVYGNCISPSPSIASSSDSLRDQCISPTPSEESNVSTSSYSYSIGRISRNKQFEVVYDHKPQLPDEIPLKKGDLVQIKQVFEDGWAYGIVKNKRLDGIFPIQCLGEEVEPARNQRMVPRLVRVYQARLEDEEQERQEEEEFKKKITDQARKNILLKLALSHPK
ncbi:hypothetical protein PIROE2DRAFT_69199 [Piromyces sp. E2]|nr:hypothetical protein PIROE2DRAFT_69199 [Piromyces sp. E2]|eukprot:OUM64704.1 hypothetical protein PIROE2DRAFT_69199 [Piromyces sp. E2]